MCSFVWERMALAIVQSNTLLIWVPQYKYAQICQGVELIDGAVMALIPPWLG